MYSFDLEQDHTGTAAAARTTATTTYQPCARGARSLQLSGAHHYHPGEQALRTAAAAVRPRRAKSSSSRKHAPSSSRRSSTTVVATDVSNFRAMVQELTGFFPPPAAVFRPLPRRVHAASPSVAVGQGCGWERRGSHGSSEAANSSTAGGGSTSSPDEGTAVPPPLVVAPQPQPQFAPLLGVFDGLPDLGSPEFGSWGDLSID